MPRMITPADGFFLALHLVGSLGAGYDRAELLRRLRDVASGDLTVFDSPEEELAKLEAEKGRGTDEERAAFLAAFASRADTDAHHRATAAAVLAEVAADEGPPAP